MGFNGWITPNSWNGYLIPISLLAFLGVINPAAINRYN
jgi:hypothetical protein